MVVIVDYGMGNLGSIANMIRKLGGSSVISSDPETVLGADKLILPGVGAFDHGMANLQEKGLLAALNSRVIEQKVPVLGICLGMQLMGRGSEEGDQPGLGWIDGSCIRFNFDNSTHDLRIPHMGWNTVIIKQQNRLIDNDTEDTRFYFVHSYHFQCNTPEQVLATTVYGYEFPCAVANGNILGVQFHPEKSHKFGMRLLTHFIENY